MNPAAWIAIGIGVAVAIILPLSMAAQQRKNDE